MNKFITSSAILVSAFFLSSCQIGNKPADAPAADTTSQMPGTGSTQGKSNLSEIAAKVLAGGAYNCSFIDPETKQTLTYVAQGKKLSMKMSGGTDQAQSMSRMLTDGTTIYIWDDSTKKGMKMAADVSETDANLPQDLGNQADMPDFSNAEEMEKLQQQYQVDCQPTTVSAGEFQPPKDVAFEDMAQMMEMMKKYQAPQ